MVSFGINVRRIECIRLPGKGTAVVRLFMLKASLEHRLTVANASPLTTWVGFQTVVMSIS